MRTQLSVTKRGERDWLFTVTFENNSTVEIRLPIEAIERSGDRLGLKFALDGVENEPVDFTIVSPKVVPVELSLLANQRTEVQFVGRLEDKGQGVAALSFAHAVYKVEAGKTYKIGFVWHDMKSNLVDWSAA